MAVVAHHVPGGAHPQYRIGNLSVQPGEDPVEVRAQIGLPKRRPRREGALKTMLQELGTFPADMHIVLVTNAFEDNVTELVSEQVVVPSPWCNATFQDRLCIPWKPSRYFAISALAAAIAS